MKRNPLRSPYFWALLGVAGVVLFAWISRTQYKPVLAGVAAPNFTLSSLDGKQVSLSDYRGKKVVLVNVWATWCPPCREEMPSLESLYKAMKGQDFEILAVSVDAPLGQMGDGHEGGDLGKFAKEFGLTFPILHNPSGDIQELYQTTGVPESFIVGKDGVIYKKVAGASQWDMPVNQELIRRLLDS
jgi:cytochrome c biogenesis protein CcmG, thiol:disulfide interchange protein DsbE